MPSITDVSGILVGSVENREALTGCTVILTGKQGCVCGVDVRGSAPGTRETDLLDPVNAVERVHAILLSGGSAYGLDAAAGVMQYLEEKQTGFAAGPTVVPIVPAAVLFDLPVGSYQVRPDKNMGYSACQAASEKVREGNAGAGMGATVGKIKGYQYCCKSGQGTSSVQLPDGLTVGALVAVNAFGDVVDPDTGAIAAGARSDDGKSFPGTTRILQGVKEIDPFKQITNTTLAVVASNARLSKNQTTKIAQMAHNALARTIDPVHTMFDGDTIFALSTGKMDADVNVVGTMAVQALQQAVLRAVYRAETIAGIKCCTDLG